MNKPVISFGIDPRSFIYVTERLTVVNWDQEIAEKRADTSTVAECERERAYINRKLITQEQHP